MQVTKASGVFMVSAGAVLRFGECVAGRGLRCFSLADVIGAMHFKAGERFRTAGVFRQAGHQQGFVVVCQAAEYAKRAAVVAAACQLREDGQRALGLCCAEYERAAGVAPCNLLRLLFHFVCGLGLGEYAGAGVSGFHFRRGRGKSS